MLMLQRLLSKYSSQVHFDGFKHGQPKGALVPGDELVYDSSLLNVFPNEIVNVGIQLAEVGHDG